MTPSGSDIHSKRPGGTAALRRPQLWLVLAVVLVAAGYTAVELTFLEDHLGFPLDDSWIHLQFARNLATGEGLSYNAGELVAGSTAPLWTALLALLFLLPGNVVLWTKALGVALFAGAVLATYRLGRELDLSRGAAALAAALTLSTYWLVWSALSGMEIPLFLFLSLGGMVLQVRERRHPERPPLALAVFGLAALARPEGLLLLVLAAAERLLAARLRTGALAGEDADPVLHLGHPAWRKLAFGLALATLALVPTLLVHQAISGSPFPTTFGAKAGEARRWFPNGQYLYLVQGILIRPQPLMVLLFAPGLVALLSRLGTPRDRGLLPALWVLALPLAYSLMTPEGRHQLVGNFGRYYFPLFPPMIVVGMLGAVHAGRALGRRWSFGGIGVPVRALALGLLLVPTFVTLVQGAARYAQNVVNVEDSDVAMGHWMRDNLPADALVAVQDVGAIKYFGGQPILDMVGLVTPEIQHYIREAAGPQDPLGQAGVDRFLTERRPDYIVAFPDWHPAVTGDRSRFTPLLRLEIPGNITMAEREMIVYATPWTREPPRGFSRRPPL